MTVTTWTCCVVLLSYIMFCSVVNTVASYIIQDHVCTLVSTGVNILRVAMASQYHVIIVK